MARFLLEILSNKPHIYIKINYLLLFIIIIICIPAVFHLGRFRGKNIYYIAYTAKDENAEKSQPSSAARGKTAGIRKMVSNSKLVK
jgi:hypothetical protein